MQLSLNFTKPKPIQIPYWYRMAKYNRLGKYKIVDYEMETAWLTRLIKNSNQKK